MFTVGKMGSYLPWALASSMIMLIGAGLTTTLTVEATVAQWVMYQFVAGFGRGCGMQTVRQPFRSRTHARRAAD
jgi:hypothetical protein